MLSGIIKTNVSARCLTWETNPASTCGAAPASSGASEPSSRVGAQARRLQTTRNKSQVGARWTWEGFPFVTGTEQGRKWLFSVFLGRRRAATAPSPAESFRSDGCRVTAGCWGDEVSKGPGRSLRFLTQQGAKIGLLLRPRVQLMKLRYKLVMKRE